MKTLKEVIDCINQKARGSIDPSRELWQLTDLLSAAFYFLHCLFRRKKI